MVLGRHSGRLSEEAAPNVKNRSHRLAITLTVPPEQPPQSVQGVLVAQGGRFGGWSLYVVSGHLHYAYNRYGRDLTMVRAEPVIWPGDHEVVLDFEYDGGPPGSGGLARIALDGREIASGRVDATTAYDFAFDETFNVGIDRGSPVVDDYPALRNAFTGRIDRVGRPGPRRAPGAGGDRAARQPRQRLIPATDPSDGLRPRGRRPVDRRPGRRARRGRHRGAAGAGSAVGAVPEPLPDPLSAWREPVQDAWIDYNGHLSEAYYVLVLGHATDAVMDAVGLGALPRPGRRGRRLSPRTWRTRSPQRGWRLRPRRRGPSPWGDPDSSAV